MGTIGSVLKKGNSVQFAAGKIMPGNTGTVMLRGKYFDKQ